MSEAVSILDLIRAITAAEPLTMNTLRILSPLCLIPIVLGNLCAQDPGEPVLERYVLGAGQNTDGVAAAVGDKFFGGGTARAAITFFDAARRFNPDDHSGSLILFVGRHVRPDEITFALLCSGVEVRGFDSEGTLVFSKDLPGFTFGDSQGGRYTKVIRSIPLSVATLNVTFRGNYE